MEEEYYKRIDDNFLKADYVDGEVLQHTDLNELENVVKTAVNANYEDIQKLRDGTYLIGNSERLDGATLSKYDTETLQASDTKVPTSMQVKEYVDTEISHIDLEGYYTKREVDDLIDDAIDDTLEIVDERKQNILYTEIKNRPSDNPFNFDTCDSGLYYVKDSYIIIGEQTYNVNGVFPSTFCVTDWSDGDEPRRDIVTSDGYKFSIDRLGESSYELDQTISGYFVTESYLELLDFVKHTDHANTNRTGVIRLTDVSGLSTNNYGELFLTTYNYSTYSSKDANLFISKGTLENVITGKELLTPTSYATKSKGGAIKLSDTNKTKVDSNGVLYADTVTFGNYPLASNNMFISKGTLENVITGELTKRDDYATNAKGGTIRTNADSGTYVEYHQPTDPDVGNNGILRTLVKTYSEYTNALNTLFIGKGTLENVITGKGLVSNTDYASDSVAGVIKTNWGSGTYMSNGALVSRVADYNTYQQLGSSAFISKGTLENVITGKDLTTKAYVDGLVGDIGSVLDTIQGEVI